MGWSISWLDIILLLLAVLGLVYYFGTKTFSVFEKYGIKTVQPHMFIGNMLPILMGTKHLNVVVQDIYNKFSTEKYVGFFNFSVPVIVLRDLELIKSVTVKNFDHFTDHFQIANEGDPLFYHNLFALLGEKWHQMRTTLSPAFTSSKMKEMMPFVTECSERFIEYLKKQCDSPIAKEKGYSEMELKDLLTKCTNDVIASCAFGIQTDSLTDPDNEFYRTTKVLTHIKLKDILMSLSLLIFPVLKKFITIKLMDEKVANFYRYIVMDIIKKRTKTGVIRRDMIHLLMLAMKGSLQYDNSSEKLNENVGYETVREELKDKISVKRVWTDDEITAQAVIFLFAGFDTTSTLLTFMCYELALNPEVQSRLREEVDMYIKEKGNKIVYNDIRSLAYMDMVTSETLRLWPPAGNLDRVCVKPFTLPPPNGQSNSYKVEKGDLLWIPAYSIHRDPEFFPNPEEFIPERFSEENKVSIDMAAHLPFGIGPRSCIGNRFALMEVKIIMFNLLANFEIIRTPNTVVPVKIMSHFFNLTSQDGFTLGLKKREGVA